MGKNNHRPCPRCKGAGTIEFDGVWSDTLRALKRQSREINGADLARIIGANPTAVNNRLTALERMGLATGRVYGRQRLWKAT
jgi:DNA-binding transcriptional ArsR family regulator